MDNKQDPFVAADWKGAKCINCGGLGQEFETKGSIIKATFCTFCKGTGRVPYPGVWMPKQEIGMVAIHKETHKLHLIETKIYSYINEHDLPDACGWDETDLLPLLPAPDTLTRLQAIAALERAGFKANVPRTDNLHWYIFIGQQKLVASPTAKPTHRVWIVGEPGRDLETARHTLDCADTIKAWCAKVDWSVQDG